MRQAFVGFCLISALVSASTATATEKPASPPPCAAKTKSKIANIERKGAEFAKKVASYKAKHKQVKANEGRMPASFCADEKNGMIKAAKLAQEGFPLTDDLESIERNPNTECANLAKSARIKIDDIFMDINKSFIQTCASPFSP